MIALLAVLFAAAVPVPDAVIPKAAPAAQLQQALPHGQKLVQALHFDLDGDGRKLRVLDLVPTEENPSGYVGLLTVAVAPRARLGE